MTTHGSLQVHGLVMRFAGQTQALFEIPSLQLDAGQSLGIRGPSGAGKTTLFHCLAGIAQPSAGKVRWDDTDICALPASAGDRWRHQQLGLIFQDFHLVDGLSALDNVLLPAHFDRWTPAATLRQRARALLTTVGIDAQDRMAALLSRGERQRVAFARALLFSPKVIMADEPTASLDPDHRTQIGELLMELVRKEGATLIVISHEEELLQRMDRCVTLRDGALRDIPAEEPRVV